MCFLATTAMQQAVCSGIGSGNNQNNLWYGCANFYVSNFIWAIITGLCNVHTLPRYTKHRLFQPWKGERKNFIKTFGTLSHFDLLAKLSQCVKFGILTTNLNTFSLNCCTILHCVDNFQFNSILTRKVHSWKLYFCKISCKRCENLEISLSCTATT